MAAGDPDTPIFNALLAEYPTLPKLLEKPPKRSRIRRTGKRQPPLRQPHDDDPFELD